MSARNLKQSRHHLVSNRTIAQELQWLQDNPQFRERPATLREFIRSKYLNIESKVRKRILSELEIIIGKDVRADKPTEIPLAMITGGIGIGKTTIASIVLPYLCHWMLCLKDPQDFFGLLPGSRIAFMQMSTSEKQALEVVFGDIKARIQGSPWFRDHPYDPAFKNQIRFDNDIWIIPGDSKDTTFEGYNIFGGILDEADSHTVTETKDYAEIGFDTIENRIASRFQDKGFLLVIGQMKSATGFASRKYEELSLRKPPDAYAVRMAIWDSMGEDYYGDMPSNGRNADGTVKKFFYDPMRKHIVPDGVTQLIGDDAFLEIPILYQRQFSTNPEKALKDLAGMPPLVNDPFISLINKIESCRDRWVLHHGGLPSPITPEGRIAPWFVAKDTLPRVLHIDIAYSAKGDALGLAMGHVKEMVVIDGERKPYIVMDMLMRIKARAGGEIFLADVRQFIYNLKTGLGFKLKKVTMDGFESTDTKQQFERRRFQTEYVSVDKDILPYHDLREAIYEDRFEFPPYLVDVTNDNGTRRLEILVKELSELMDTGKKIDHPQNGSKDVADSCAGVVFTLMGDRQYRKNVVSLESARQRTDRMVSGMNYPHHALRGDFGSGSAPIPPSITPWSN